MPRSTPYNRGLRAALFLALALAAPVASFAATPVLVPTIVGGSDNGTTRRTLLTDSSGRLLIVGAAAGGVAYGPDTQGVAPTQAPITIGCTFASPAVAAGQIVRAQCDAAGRLIINAIQSGTWNIGAIASALPTGGNVIGLMGQSGVWTVQPGNTANTTAWLVNGNVTGADGSGLTNAIKTFANGGLFNGTSEDLSRAVNGASGGAGVGVQAVAQVPNSSANVGITSAYSASAVSSLVLKASPGNLYRYRVTTTAAGYVLVSNTTTALTNGATSNVQCTQVPAGTTEVDHSQIPDVFSTGITLNFSSTGCATVTTSAVAYFEGSFK